MEAHRVSTLPSLYLIPDYINEAIESQLFSTITSSRAKWTVVNGRRLQTWGGSIGKRGALIPAQMPSWLASLVDRVSGEFGIFGPQGANHVLINEYEPGQGIMSHQDGPVYESAVGILSLGSPTVMDFHRRRESDDPDSGERVPAASVLLPPRSLLIFKDDAYTECLHGIEAAVEEPLGGSVVNPNASNEPGLKIVRRTGIRLSLTIRRVLKVHAFGLFK